jgi:hypothetical protein
MTLGMEVDMLRAILCVCIAAPAFGGCGSDKSSPESPPEAGYRSHLSSVGLTPHTLDYSDPAMWLCSGGSDQNECDVDLDATKLLSDKTTSVAHHVRATNPAFDCFYVYPTVNITGATNTTDFSDVSYELDPLLAQAARFNRVCEVYAPLYRQASLVQIETGDQAAVALAAGDVAEALQYYLTNLNNGRNFVIMGHSQGTMTLITAMQALVDNDPTVRSRLISALLIGAPSGWMTASTFQNIPICATAGETGCVIAYSSFDVAAPPGANALFGASGAACVNPGDITGNSSVLLSGSYFPMHVNNSLLDTPWSPPAGITTPFVLFPDKFSAQCVFGTYNYLEIMMQADQRTTPPYRNSNIESQFGLHLVDYNLPLEDLINEVELQASNM